MIYYVFRKYQQLELFTLFNRSTYYLSNYVSLTRTHKSLNRCIYYIVYIVQCTLLRSFYVEYVQCTVYIAKI